MSIACFRWGHSPHFPENLMGDPNKHLPDPLPPAGMTFGLCGLPPPTRGSPQLNWGRGIRAGLRRAAPVGNHPPSPRSLKDTPLSRESRKAASRRRSVTTPLRRLSLGAGEQGRPTERIQGALGHLLTHPGPCANKNWPRSARRALGGGSGAAEPSGGSRIRRLWVACSWLQTGAGRPGTCRPSGRLRTASEQDPQTSHFYLYFIFLLLLLFCVHFLLFFP